MRFEAAASPTLLGLQQNIAAYDISLPWGVTFATLRAAIARMPVELLDRSAMRSPHLKHQAGAGDAVDTSLAIASFVAAALALGLAAVAHGPSWTRATGLEPVRLGEAGLWSESVSPVKESARAFW